MSVHHTDTDPAEYENENYQMMSDEAIEFVRVWDWE
jgi:hypothetical protein